VGVAEVGKPAQGAGAVGADRGAGLDDSGGEVDQLGRAGLGGDGESDSAQAAGLVVFYGDHDRDLVAVAAHPAAGHPADHRLLELHDPGQPIAFRADHGAAHLVHPRPPTRTSGPQQRTRRAREPQLLLRKSRALVLAICAGGDS